MLWESAGLRVPAAPKLPAPQGLRRAPMLRLLPTRFELKVDPAGLARWRKGHGAASFFIFSRVNLRLQTSPPPLARGLGSIALSLYLACRPANRLAGLTEGARRRELHQPSRERGNAGGHSSSDTSSPSLSPRSPANRHFLGLRVVNCSVSIRGAPSPKPIELPRLRFYLNPLFRFAN